MPEFTVKLTRKVWGTVAELLQGDGQDQVGVDGAVLAPNVKASEAAAHFGMNDGRVHFSDSGNHEFVECSPMGVPA
jgi:hypothetical protein